MFGARNGQYLGTQLPFFSAQTLTKGSSTPVVIPAVSEKWPMNEGSGQTFFDATANADNISSTTAPWTWVAGKATFSNSLGIGANQTATNWTGNTPFTVSAWVNMPTASSSLGQTVISTLDPANNFVGWELSTNGSPTGGIQFLLVQNLTTPTYIFVQGPQVLVNGALTHLVVTSNGNGLASGIVAYVNGVSQTLTILKDTFTGSAVNTVPVQVGARKDASTPLAGVIGDIRLYTAALTQAQVSLLFAKGLNG